MLLSRFALSLILLVLLPCSSLAQCTTWLFNPFTRRMDCAQVAGAGSGTVTSVGLTAPGELTVSGSPITTSGAIALTWTAQSGNKVLASPSDGSSGAIAARTLVVADIPSGVTKGTLSTSNVLLKVSGADTVIETGCTVNASNALTCPGGFVGGGETAGLVTLYEDTASGNNFRKISVPGTLTADLEFRFENAVPGTAGFWKVGAPAAGVSTVSVGAIASSEVPAAVIDSSANSCADAGVSDTYACTLSPAIASYTTGAHYRFKANTANTGAATLNLNAVGAITIKKAAGGITTDLADNDIRAGQWVDVAYDGTNFQMQSLLGNAPSGGTAKWFLEASGRGDTVASSTTEWFGPGSTASVATNDNNVHTRAAHAITITRLAIKFGGTQSATGDMTCYLYKNAVQTADISVVVTNGDGANPIKTDTGSTAVAQDDSISLGCVNAATAASVQVWGWAMGGTFQ